MGASLAQAGVAGLNACYGNTVMLGVPLVTAAFGAEGVGIMLPVIALHSMLLLPMATVLIEADGLGKGGAGTRNPVRVLAATLPSVVRNPIILSLAAALLWRALAVPEPVALHRLLAMLGAGAPALALFGLGASLPDFAAQGSVRETGVAAVLKLVVQPLLDVGAGACGRAGAAADGGGGGHGGGADGGQRLLPRATDPGGRGIQRGHRGGEHGALGAHAERSARGAAALRALQTASARGMGATAP